MPTEKAASASPGKTSAKTLYSGTLLCSIMAGINPGAPTSHQYIASTASYQPMPSKPSALAPASQRRLPPVGGGGDNDDMETRVKILEQVMADVRERLARIEARVDQTATKGDVSEAKSDLHKAINAQTWRLIGAVSLLVAAVFFVVRFVPLAS